MRHYETYRRVAGLLLCLIVLIVPSVLADTTGYKFPSTNLTLSNGGWGLATNAFANDGSNAVGHTVNQTNYSGFSFGIPAGSTIDGITVLVESSCSSGTGVNGVTVRVGNGSTWSGQNFTGDISTTVTNSTFGGATNLYALTWNGSNINNLVLNLTSNSSSTARTMNMDFVAVDIAYSPPWINYTAAVLNDSQVYAGETLNFSTRFETKNTVSMDKIMFGWNATGVNCTGGFQNVTNFTSNNLSQVVNASVVVPSSCSGKTIGWAFYANNTVSTNNNTGIQTFVANSTCTPYAGTNWVINAADTCNVTSQSLSVQNITIVGSGTVIFNNTNISATGCVVQPTAGQSLVIVYMSPLRFSNAC